eukprot:gene10597-3115_t
MTTESDNKKFFPSYVVDGAKLLYNSEYEKCENVLSKYLDFCPFANYLKGEIYTMRSFTTQSREDREKVLEWSAIAETLANDIISNDKKLVAYIQKVTDKTNISDQDKKNWKVALKILIGDAILGRGMSQMQINQYVYGAWNLNKSYKMYDSILKKSKSKNEENIHPDVILNLKYGVGLFNFIVSMIPYPSVQSILSLIGFKGDGDLGIQYLKDNYEGDGLKSAYASMILLMSYLMIPTAYSSVEENLKMAKPIIDFCKEKYPNGSMIQYIVSMYERKTGNAEGALEALESGVKSCQEINIEPKMFIWEIGNCHMMSLNWEPAIEQLEKVVLKSDEGFEFLSLCALQLACLYSMAGKDKESIEILGKVDSFCSKKGKFDEIASKKSKEILESQDKSILLYSMMFEILFFRRDVAHMSEKHLNDSLEHLDKLSKSLNLDENKKEKNAQTAQIVGYYVIQAAVYNGLKKVDEAKKSYLKAISYSDYVLKNGLHWIVAANYDVSEIFFREKDFKSCESYLNAAGGYSNYDWDQVYKSRINKAKKEFKKLTK